MRLARHALIKYYLLSFLLCGLATAALSAEPVIPNVSLPRDGMRYDFGSQKVRTYCVENRVMKGDALANEESFVSGTLQIVPKGVESSGDFSLDLVSTIKVSRKNGKTNVVDDGDKVTLSVTLNPKGGIAYVGKDADGMLKKSKQFWLHVRMMRVMEVVFPILPSPWQGAIVTKGSCPNDVQQSTFEFFGAVTIRGYESVGDSLNGLQTDVTSTFKGGIIQNGTKVDNFLHAGTVSTSDVTSVTLEP